MAPYITVHGHERARKGRSVSLEENKAVARALYEVANTGNPDLLEEVISPRWVVHSKRPGEEGYEGGLELARQSLAMKRNALPGSSLR